MADKKRPCDCGCISSKQNSAKATRDKKNVKRARESK